MMPPALGKIRTLGLLTYTVLGLLSCGPDDPDEPDVTFDTVNGFVISDQGEKYLATDKGLLQLDEAYGAYRLVQGEVKNTPLNDLAFSRTTTPHELWVSSDSWAYNQTAGYYTTTENSGLSNNRVIHLHFDEKLNGYFATPDGLDIMGETEWIHSPGMNDLFLDYEITDMGTATNGYTYVTTLGGGIERFRMDVDGISGSTLMDTDWTWLESNNILTVCIDDTIQAYGTDKGAALHFSEYTKWDWEILTTANGLINDTVLAIVRDNSMNWWFGTRQGLSMYNEAAWTAYTVASHGLLSNHIKFLAMDTDGSVWMATDLGLSRLTGEQVTNYPK